MKSKNAKYIDMTNAKLGAYVSLPTEFEIVDFRLPFFNRVILCKKWGKTYLFDLSKTVAIGVKMNINDKKYKRQELGMVMRIPRVLVPEFIEQLKKIK